MESDISTRAFRRSWPRLIQKVYQVDPLVCPKCRGEMRTISFIEDNAVVEKILRHCGLWEGPLRTLATARAPPKARDLDREPAEPRELQLVLDPEYLKRVSAAVSNTPNPICAKRVRRSGGTNSPIAQNRLNSRVPWHAQTCPECSRASQWPVS